MELHSTSPIHNLSVLHCPHCSIGFLSTWSKFPALKFRVAISSVDHHFFYQYFTISSTHYTLILSSSERINPDLSVLPVPLYFLNNFMGLLLIVFNDASLQIPEAHYSDPAQASSLLWRLEEVPSNLFFTARQFTLHEEKKYDILFSTLNSVQMSLSLLNFKYLFLSALSSHSLLWPSQYWVHI